MIWTSGSFAQNWTIRGRSSGQLCKASALRSSISTWKSSYLPRVDVKWFRRTYYLYFESLIKQPACHMGVKAKCAPCLRKKENFSSSFNNWFSPSSQHPPSQLTGIHHGRHNIDRASHRPEFQQCGGGPSDSTSPPKLHTTHLGRHFCRLFRI